MAGADSTLFDLFDVSSLGNALVGPQGLQLFHHVDVLVHLLPLSSSDQAQCSARTHLKIPKHVKVFSMRLFANFAKYVYRPDFHYAWKKDV